MTKRPSARIAIRGKTWKKKSSISEDKFKAVARAISAVLPAKPIRFTELVERVRAKLPGFQGSVAWYTISVARELEVQGKLLRSVKPVLYSKPRAPKKSK
jgi:hypothetical protein